MRRGGAAPGHTTRAAVADDTRAFGCLQALLERLRLTLPSASVSRVLDVLDADGKQLHLAASIPDQLISLRLIRLLLSYGANPGICSAAGLTPEAFAGTLFNMECMQLLRSAAASAVSQGGFAPAAMPSAFSLQYLQQQHQLVQQQQRTQHTQQMFEALQLQRSLNKQAAALEQVQQRQQSAGAAAGAAGAAAAEHGGRPLASAAGPQLSTVGTSGGHVGGGNSVNSGMTSSISSIESGGSARPRCTTSPYRHSYRVHRGRRRTAQGRCSRRRPTARCPT